LNRLNQQKETINNTQNRTPISAFPYPSIEWQKDGRTCVEGPQYSIENGPNYTTLILKSTAKSDKGKYTLMLTNKHGDDRATVAMNISDRPDAPGKPIIQVF
jgi:hypothetical protein